MTRFKVTVKYTVTKTCYVNAEDWEIAEEKAADVFASSSESDYHCSDDVYDTEEEC